MEQIKLNISTSPHIHGGDSIRRNMCTVLIALLPALLVSVLLFGLGAITVVVTSVAACVFFEWFITKFLLKQPCTIGDCSAVVTGLLLAFNLPSNLPLYIIIAGALVAIGIGKLTFGGLGNNPFNPALVGRVFLLVSFPAAMTSWPETYQLTSYVDAATCATPLAIMKQMTYGQATAADLPGLWLLFQGKTAGSLGEVSSLALLLGFFILLYRKVITWHIPTAIFATVFVLGGLFFFINPDTYANPFYHLLSGGLILGAVFMATDFATSPMTPKGMLVYGVGIGVITVVIRNFGSYPEGMSFAILLMNSVTPLLNKYCKPKRFGVI